MAEEDAAETLVMTRMMLLEEVMVLVEMVATIGTAMMVENADARVVKETDITRRKMRTPATRTQPTILVGIMGRFLPVAASY